MANPMLYDQSDFVGSTPINSVDPEQLRQELEAESFASTPVTFSRVDIQRTGADFDVQVYFSGEPDATDETTLDSLIAAHTALGATDPPPSQAPIDGLVATLDVNPADVQTGIDGPVTIDWSRLDHTITLTGNLTADDITFTNLPAAGQARRITLKVLQGGAGTFTITATAWPDTGGTSVDWGTKTAPTFGEATDEFRVLVFYYDGAVVTGYYDTNVFG